MNPVILRYFTRRPGFFARKVAIASADKMIWFTDLAAWWTWVAPRDLWNRGPPKAGSKASRNPGGVVPRLFLGLLGQAKKGGKLPTTALDLLVKASSGSVGLGGRREY